MKRIKSMERRDAETQRKSMEVMTALAHPIHGVLQKRGEHRLESMGFLRVSAFKKVFAYMKHAVKHIHFGGMASLSREQGSRMRDATGREGCRMPTFRPTSWDAVR